MAPSTEATNPELDALLLESPDDPQLSARYAEWLEPRDAPRALVIRLSLESERRAALAAALRAPGAKWELPPPDPLWSQREALIREHWPRWFGALPPDALELSWHHGFPDHVRLRRPLTGMSACGEFLSLTALRFTRAVVVESGVGRLSAEGLDRARGLRKLEWSAKVPGNLGALAGQSLPRLQSLQLELQGAPSPVDAAGLRGLRAPSLETFTLDCRPEAEGVLLAAILAAPWLSGLTALKLQLSSDASVEQLLSASGALARVGRGLHLRGPSAVIVKHRALIRGALPHATLNPRPRPDTEDSYFCQGTPRAHAKPVYAPANFRERAGQRGFGAGITFAEAKLRVPFELCCACGGSDTRVIYHSTEHVHGRYETTYFNRCEYECRSCASFTSWEHHWIS